MKKASAEKTSAEKASAEKEYGMKSAVGWILLLAAALVAFFVIGYYAGRTGGKTGGVSSATKSSSMIASSKGAASEEAASSEAASKPAASKPSASSAVSSAAGKGTTAEQAIAKIQAGINMDWKKYTLQQVTPSVSVGGKTYLTFSMWDQDYQQGPMILVDPDTGKLYTYTNLDKAPVPAETDPAFDQTVKSVTGVIKDGAMMSILIKTPDGKQLTVRRLGVDLVNLNDGFIIGNTVKVYYTGVIQDNSMQRAFVTKIEGVQS